MNKFALNIEINCALENKKYAIPGIYCIAYESILYIGKTINIERRLRQHISKLNCKKHHNSKLQNYYNKYKDKFTYHVIEFCSKEDLSEKETYYIKIYDTYLNGFNLTTDEIYKLRAEDVKKLKEKNYKISIKLKNKKFSNEHIKTLVESRIKNGTFAGIKNPKARGVIMFDLEGYYLATYSTLKEAATINELSYSQISMVCSGKRTQTKGYKFKYI